MFDPTMAIFTVVMTMIVGPAFLVFLNRKKTGADLAQTAINMTGQLMQRLDEANQKINTLEQTVDTMKSQKTAPIRVEVVLKRDGHDLTATAMAEYVIESVEG